MNILMIGDVIGKPGRTAVKKLLPALKREVEADFTVVNCENAAHGKGITAETAEELFRGGADVLTGGNHIFHVRSALEYIDREERIIRPLNYPPNTWGRGCGVFDSAAGFPVAVMNACGRAFMANYDDPFRAIDKEIARVRTETPIILVDFHAEATSEKVAMGWYLDGRATAVVGTHTHIPTADERVLPKGTGYITDLGMTGPYDSVIGVEKEAVLEALLTLLPQKFDVPDTTTNVRLCGVLLKIDPLEGRTKSIERIRRDLA